MRDLMWSSAEVTSLDDPLQKGRIQVRLLPDMIGTRENLLPWYEPLIGCGSNSEYEFNPPKKGSTIIVFPQSETLRDGYYLGGDHIQGFFDYSVVKSIIDTSGANSDYPNVRFVLYDDGSVMFHNSVTGDHGIIHSSGSYQLIDSGGNLTFHHHENSDFKINASGVSIEDKNGNSIVMGTTSVKINNNFEVLQ